MVTAGQKRGGRRHFVGAALTVAVALIGMIWAVRRPVALEEDTAQQLLQQWLAADYEQALEDPALRTSTAPENASAAVLTIAHLELRRPWIKPADAASAALARLDVRTIGLPSTDTDGVRCFLLVRNEGEEWSVRREISESAFRWRLGF